jgi:hypothetical protein
MGLDTKTYWLTDRQSQCDLDLDLDLEEVSLEIVASEDSWDPAMAKGSWVIEYWIIGPEAKRFGKW